MNSFRVAGKFTTAELEGDDAASVGGDCLRLLDSADTAVESCSRSMEEPVVSTPYFFDWALVTTQAGKMAHFCAALSDSRVSWPVQYLRGWHNFVPSYVIAKNEVNTCNGPSRKNSHFK